MRRLVSLVVRVMVAVALLLPVCLPGAEAAAPKVFPKVSVTFPGVSGAAAVSALGSNLAAVAAYYGKTADQLRRALLRDKGLRVGRGGRLYHSSPAATPGVIALSAASAHASLARVGSLAVTLNQTFQLHSNRGATKTIYLNFVGETLTPTNSQFCENLDQTEIIVPPFSTDNNPAFSDSERAIIEEIWQRVSEDYAPFDVDVTTEPVAADRLNRTDQNDTLFGLEVLFAPRATVWNDPGAAADSFAWSFSSTDNDRFNTAVVFHQGNAISAHLLADAASREIGNTMGLEPDGTGETPYYAGQGDSPVNGWVPIMGALSGKPLSQFSQGEYDNASNGEDDVQQIIDNGVALRADEAGGTIATAALLPVESTGGRGVVSFDGVITSADDKDVFAVRAAAGLLTINANPAPVGANADLVLTLLDASGHVLQTSNPLHDLSAAISRQIAAPGLYYLEVKGTGEGDPMTTGYTSYGSIGAYKLTGSFATPSNSQPSAVFSAVIPSTPLTVTLDASASADDGRITSYHWSFGDGTTRDVTTPGPFQKIYRSAGTYDVTLEVTDDTGLKSSAHRLVIVTAAPQAPVAAFTTSVSSGIAPLAVSFNPAGSSDDGRITAYAWDFGDGTTRSEATGTTVSKTYATPGTFTVTLKVTDDGGLTATITKVITVKADSAPVASFSASTVRGHPAGDVGDDQVKWHGQFRNAAPEAGRVLPAHHRRAETRWRHLSAGFTDVRECLPIEGNAGRLSFLRRSKEKGEAEASPFPSTPWFLFCR